MVIGAFGNSSDAEVCLTNLAEAGFTPRTISVVAQDPAFAATLSHAKGPLHARPIERVWVALRAIGVPEATLSIYAGALAAGGVLIALTVPSAISPVAQEMLTDHHVSGVTTTPSNPAALPK